MEFFVNSSGVPPKLAIRLNTTRASAVNGSGPTANDGYNGENIISAVFLSVLASVVVIGNGMVMLAFKVNYKLRTVTNMCFVSLALCDFLVGVISIPLWIYYTFNDDDNMHLYLFYISFDIFNGTASIFQLTAISLERCFSIVAPVRHRSMPVFFYYAMVFSVWFLAIVSTLLRLLPQKNVTGADWYNVYTILVCFVLPVVIMITSYSLLFRTAMKRTRMNMRSSKNKQVSWSSQRKTIITLIIVTGLFVIAWSPFFIYLALNRYLPEALPSTIEGRTHLWRFVKWMHYSNSCLNPFVYSYRNREFNYSFKMILRACIKCKRFEEVNRQFKRPTRFGLRRHTRDGNSQTMYGGQQTMRSSLRGSFREEITDSVRGAESIRLNTIQPKEIEVSVIDVNSNGKAKSV